MAGGYWLCPARMAATAASSTEAGPSVSGNPWPRLIDPVDTASADISPKMVEPKPRIRSTTSGSGGGGSVMARIVRDPDRVPRVSRSRGLPCERWSCPSRVP